MQEMKKLWKLTVFFIMLLLGLCISKRMDTGSLAVHFLFPNLAHMMQLKVYHLPVTAEINEKEPMQETIVQIEPELDVREQLAKENSLSFETLLEEDETSAEVLPEEPAQPVYVAEQLKDFEFLLSRIYNVDSSTATSPQQLDAEKLLNYDFRVEKNTEGPQILIYHTHSQETFADSIPGDEGTSIVGMGSYLTSLLQQKGYKVLHHKEVFDMIDGVLDRNKAYTRAEPVIAKLIEENPSIQIVIDLHRDGVGDNVHLVTEVNGKPTAKVMFFNGLSYSAKNGPIGYLENPYLENNLALTMQMKLAADTLAPGFARKIYLKSLRFNLHLHPGAMLIEAGAQTNTVEEMRNAMEVLAQILGDVLY